MKNSKIFTLIFVYFFEIIFGIAEVGFVLFGIASLIKISGRFFNENTIFIENLAAFVLVGFIYYSFYKIFGKIEKNLRKYRKSLYSEKVEDISKNE